MSLMDRACSSMPKDSNSQQVKSLPRGVTKTRPIMLIQEVIIKQPIMWFGSWERFSPEFEAPIPISSRILPTVKSLEREKTLLEGAARSNLALLGLDHVSKLIRVDDGTRQLNVLGNGLGSGLLHVALVPDRNGPAESEAETDPEEGDEDGRGETGVVDEHRSAHRPEHGEQVKAAEPDVGPLGVRHKAREEAAKARNHDNITENDVGEVEACLSAAGRAERESR